MRGAIDVKDRVCHGLMPPSLLRGYLGKTWSGALDSEFGEALPPAVVGAANGAVEP